MIIIDAQSKESSESGFNAARGHEIERTNYLEHLYKCAEMPPPTPQPVVEPSWNVEEQPSAVVSSSSDEEVDGDEVVQCGPSKKTEEAARKEAERARTRGLIVNRHLGELPTADL